MRKYIIILFFVSLFFNSFSQVLETVEWKTKISKIDEKTSELIFEAKIKKGWHLYGQFFPDGGPVKMVFEFEENSNFKTIGKVEESPKPHEEMDDIFMIKVQFFDGKAIFKQKIEIIDKKDFVIKSSVLYQTCSDEKCINYDKAFDFEIKASKPKKEGSSLWNFFWISLAGGLIALLTPCIYPMIPMTVTYFMHSGGGNRKKSIFNAIIYGISIILIYIFIGTVVAVTLGEDFTNWLSTHWLPNIFFFLIFMVFAASFLGMFELTLPSSMINKSDSQVDKGGILGSFFMAFTLVLVSFSCTAPIVGSILALSAQGEVLMPIVGMLGFSFAFALPFTLFAIFPSTLESLPKSGGWLNSVKVVLGFIELALGLKFLSVADQTYHWGILDREIYLALWIVIFTLMGVYLLGKLKFSHDSDLPFLSVPRLSLAIVTFSFVIYLIPGMFGAPLKSLAGWLPPQETHDFDMNAIVRDNIAMIEFPENQTNNTNKKKKLLCEEAKYSDILHLPHGLKGYFDLEQAISCAKKENKPIFVDFTGHGCVNCREMEQKVWAEKPILKRLRKDFVILAMYVDDKKIDLPENEWITAEDGRIKKTLGGKNSYIQRTKFKSNAQPYYYILDVNGKILTEPQSYNLDINNFINFLDDGLKKFNEK